MKGFEEFMGSFGFREGPFIVAILCIVVLLANFMGGLFSNIILAMSGRPIVKRPLVQRTSFRLVAASEFFFIAYIVYYHTILTSGIVVAQVIFWNLFAMGAPMLAIFGAQISYLGFKKKIDELKSGVDEFEEEEADPDDYEDYEEATFETSTPEANLSEHKGYRQ